MSLTRLSQSDLEPPSGAGSNGPAPKAAPSMSAKGQLVESIVVNGPDPAQSEWWNGLWGAVMGTLNSLGAPWTVRFGMKGSPPTTYYGDPGPLGGLPAPNYGAGNALALLNADQALPATSSPGPTSQTLKSILGVE